METLFAMARMRAVRSFADRPLEADHLERILWAGHRAPSSKNRQRWAFVVVQDRRTLCDLAEVGDFAGHLAGAGAGVALVTPETDDPDRRAWVMLDAGQVAQNMLLAAWDLGVGGAHAAVYREGRVRELLGYPEDHRCDLLLSLGYPSDGSLMATPPRRGGRRPLHEMVHHERW